MSQEASLCEFLPKSSADCFLFAKWRCINSILENGDGLLVSFRVGKVGPVSRLEEQCDYRERECMNLRQCLFNTARYVMLESRHATLNLIDQSVTCNSCKSTSFSISSAACCWNTHQSLWLFQFPSARRERSKCWILVHTATGTLRCDCNSYERKLVVGSH